MKKSLLLTASVLLALGLITVVKRRAAESRSVEGPGDPEKQRIRTFWETYNRATDLRLHGDFEDAASAYRESLRLDPQHEDSLYYLGASQEEQGEYSEAAATYRKLVELNPASGRAFSELGNTLSLIAPGAPMDFDEARHAYLECIRVNREQAGPFLHLGMLDLNQGRYPAALDNFRIAAGFGSPEGNFWLGYTLFLQGKYREAVQPLRKVLESYAKSRQIVGRGVLSEGDILPAPGQPLTALDKAGLKSMLLLYWTSQRLGGYPPEVPREFQVQKPSKVENRPAAIPPGLTLPKGQMSWADFDKDGRPGLLVVGPGQPVRLYRNQGGRLSDVTGSTGLAGVRDVWDASWIDYDRDGYPDLYLVRPGFVGTGQNALYHNNRNDTFTDVTARMGLAGERATTRACIADFDGDGRPDILEVGASSRGRSSIRLFKNDRNRFVDVTDQAGFATDGTAVDCAVGDYNKDGKPDVFVLLWHRDAVLYANQGGGGFLDVTAQAGLKGLRGESFSAVFFDYDRDGLPDLLVTSHAPFEEVARCLLQPSYRTAQNTPHLFRNNGRGRFEEVTAKVGLNRCYGTIQALPVDLDSDGWPELVLVSGSLDSERVEPSVVLRNLEGKEFQEWFYVPGYDRPANFSGAAVADFRRRGTPDIFFSSVSLLENHDQAARGPHVP